MPDSRKTKANAKNKTVTKTNKKPDIISVVRDASLMTYGIADIADKSAVRPVPVIHPHTKGKTKKEEAIYVTNYADRTFSVDVYLILAQAVKVSETLSEAQKAIKYNLDRAFDKSCRAVNVFAFQLL